MNLHQWFIDTFSDGIFDVLLLINVVILAACLYMHPKWREQDEAGHQAAERRREQLRGKQKV